MKKTYDEICRWLMNAPRFGARPGVENMRIAWEKMSHPGQQIPMIHVAGTNGKGSVCAFLNRILRTTGKTVGLFTSPHLVNFEERIVVDDLPIDKEAVVRIGSQLMTVDFGTDLTQSDCFLLMALLYFQEKDCDYMIIETGLGGRLDATNALGVPVVSVITAIGMDHTEILGDTLQQIAMEKAGILKKGTVLVMEQQDPEVEKILRKEAQRVQVRGVHVTTETLREKVRRLNLRMRGTYQWENAAAAMLAAAVLLIGDYLPLEQWVPEQLEQYARQIHAGFAQMDQVIEAGLMSAVWPGRMEVLEEKPLLLLDGAHNLHGAAALAQSLEQLYPNQKFHFVMGVMADKDYQKMIERILPLALDFCTITPEAERGLQAEQLAEIIRSHGVSAQTAAGTEDWKKRFKEQSKDAGTVVFGSLSFIGEVKRLFS